MEIKKLFKDAITKGSTRIFAATGLIIGLMIGACLGVSLDDFSLQAVIVWGIIIIATATILIIFDLIIDKSSRDYLKVIILVFITAIGFFLACILGIWLGTIFISSGGSNDLISSLYRGLFYFSAASKKSSIGLEIFIGVILCFLLYSNCLRRRRSASLIAFFIDPVFLSA